MSDVGDEPDLIRRWQDGDMDAFAAIVRRWQRPIARFLARFLGSEAAIADLTQDVFVRAHRAIGRYREGGTFSTWLYQIAVNLARDAARRTKHAPVPLAQPDEVAANGPSIESIWEGRERAEAVAIVLAELPGPLREVLVLRHYEGVNFEQMSRMLGVPASTLKSRFAVALARARDQLTALGYGEDQ